MVSLQFSLVMSVFLFFFFSPLMIESRSSHFVTKGKHQHPFQFLKELEGCHKGDSVKGLNQLKKYLQKFGYLPEYYTNTNSAEDESFDDLTENAIRTYQLNYNLNITGALDSKTVQHMMKPRCGVPDIVDGRTSMNSGKKHHHNSTGLYTVSDYTFFPNNPRWPSDKYHLTYGFIPDSIQVIDIQSLSSVCSSAFSKWSSVSQFTFEETQDYSSADIKIGFFSGDHGDGVPFDGPGGILAHSFAPTRGVSHFDADDSWGVDKSSDKFDLESVAVHEFGHLLGLGHSSDPNAVMQSGIGPGERRVDLDEDDIQGIHALYNN
ncbi:metalloendoproteinase 2-MMP-like [Tasmannia lanceolata]|uniref:metalloendoproteinase 2-MMP-like n=1 Tax=Tasmannia lanceolata TaxID=3420 RepID=UPI004062DCA0